MRNWYWKYHNIIGTIRQKITYIILYIKSNKQARLLFKEQNLFKNKIKYKKENNRVKRVRKAVEVFKQVA